MLKLIIFFLLFSTSLSLFSKKTSFFSENKVSLLPPETPTLLNHGSMVFITKDQDINITIYNKNKNIQIFSEFDEANYSVVSYKCGVWVQFTDSGCLVSFFTGNNAPMFDFSIATYNSTFVHRRKLLNPNPSIVEGSIDGGTNRVNLFDNVLVNTVEGQFPISSAFDYWTGVPVYWTSSEFSITYEIYRYKTEAPDPAMFDFGPHDFDGCPNSTYLNSIFTGHIC
jgi:hypothetical protein